MPDQTAVDYLGLESPVSIAEKSALPTGAGPLGITTATPTASGGGVLANASTPETGTTPRASGPGVVTTNATGAPGVPGAPVNVGGGATEAPAWMKLIQGGGSAASSLKRILAALDEKGGGGGASGGLDPSKFSFGEGEGLAGLNPADFSFDIGNLNEILPQLLKLRGAFDASGGVLDPSKFDLSGLEGTDLLSPGKFSSGVDTTITAPTGDASSGIGDAVGAALPYAGAALNLGQGIMGGDPGKALAAVAPSLLAMTGALTTGASVGDALAAGGGGPVMAAWNLPQLADTLSTLIEGGDGHDSGATLARRGGRTTDAIGLQRDVWGPLFNAHTPEDFAKALSTPVGGSTTGDALAAVIWNNLSGAWYSDTAHNWLPDLALLPLLTTLTDLGYTGHTEPSRGDVGGVGEMVMNAGQHLVPFSEHMKRADETTRYTDEGTAFNTQGFSGAEGWDRTLRLLAGVPAGAQDVFSFAPKPKTGEAALRDEALRRGVDPDTNPAGFMALAQEWQTAPPMTNPRADYLDALGKFSPEAAGRVASRDALLADNARAQYDASQTAGGG